jgi:putative endonuclease
MYDGRSPAIYILASKRNGTLYVGVTSDLCSRVLQHREGTFAGFTKRYGIKMLVWFESHDTMEGAIAREKQIKEWRRARKVELIEKANPNWLDLFVEICGREDLYSQEAAAHT